MFSKRILTFLGDHKLNLAIIIIFDVILTLLHLGTLISVTGIINVLLNQYETGNYIIDDYYKHFFWAGIFIVLILAASIIKGVAAARTNTGIKRDISNKICDKMEILGNRESNPVGFDNLSDISTEGVETLGLYLTGFVPQYINSLVTPFVLTLVLLFISKEAAIIMLAFVPLILSVYVIANKNAEKYYYKNIRKYNSIKESLQDYIKGIKELKVYQADERFQKKMQEDTDIFRKSAEKALRAQVLTITLITFLTYFGISLSIITVLVHHNEINTLFTGMSKEALIIFVILIASIFYAPLKNMTKYYHISLNGVAYGNAVYEFLTTKEAEWGKEDFNNSYNIELKNVSFTYADNARIIKDVSLKANKGDVTVIIAKSGSGKSALMKLIAGLRKNYEGDILFGKKNIRNISRENFYKHVSIISEESYLFHDTIRNNFRQVNKDINDEEIYALLEKVKLKEMIEYKGGLDLCIGGEKLKLIKGEKDRLRLAINIASDKDVYLLDDLSKNSDIESEKIILDTISELSKNKVVLMTTSRVRCASIGDKIFVLNNGDTEEKGTHSVLMKKKGIYSSMYKYQHAIEEGMEGGADDEK